MKEKEWLRCRRVDPMRRLLLDKPGLIYKGKVQQHPRGRRRLRLFAVAVARRVSHLVTDPYLLKLLDAAEQFADGVGTIKKLESLARKSTCQEYNFPEEDE